MRIVGGGALKFLAHRHIKKKGGDLDSRPSSANGFPVCFDHAPLDPDQRPLLPVGCEEHELRNSGNRRNRLPAKAHREQRVDIVDLAQLRRRVPLQAQKRVIAAHAAAVICHPDQLPPAPFDLDRDISSARVDAILDQLFNDRRGILDHLAGRDLIDGLVV